MTDRLPNDTAAPPSAPAPHYMATVGPREQHHLVELVETTSSNVVLWSEVGHGASDTFTACQRAGLLVHQHGYLRAGPWTDARDHRSRWYVQLLAPPNQQALASPTVLASRYSVCWLDPLHPEYDLFALQVEDRGQDRWAVTRHGRCLGTDGTCSPELRVTEREDDWLAVHCFDRATAIRLAKQACRHVRLGRRTVDRAAAHAQPL